jgi:hypothetical protein
MFGPPGLESGMDFEEILQHQDYKPKCGDLKKVL